jgi:hypothetical protein
MYLNIDWKVLRKILISINILTSNTFNHSNLKKNNIFNSKIFLSNLRYIPSLFIDIFFTKKLLFSTKRDRYNSVFSCLSTIYFKNRISSVFNNTLACSNVSYKYFLPIICRHFLKKVYKNILFCGSS